MDEPDYGSFEYAQLYLVPIKISVRDGLGVTIYRGYDPEGTAAWFVFAVYPQSRREVARLRLAPLMAETADGIDGRVRELLNGR